MMGDFWIVIYTHKHGLDVWPVFSESAPMSGDIIKELTAADMWEAGEEIEIQGPFKSKA